MCVSVFLHVSAWLLFSLCDRGYGSMVSSVHISRKNTFLHASELVSSKVILNLY